ncbi:hypothetical protein DFH07DRAFT_979752 [Mycena maculata]|uniref:FMN-dependent dehydrogenase domain-containing protein n=1 Tax=Mycena maculata TaxID=230809 RepID=A0AAD7N2S0_9AGAR|nr:hypothetical protein DFH07DRAFT_979752 [Mycena maculata]
MLLSYCPHKTSCNPYGHGVGGQVDTSDTVFGFKNPRPKFPPEKAFVAGEKEVQDGVFLGMERMKENHLVSERPRAQTSGQLIVLFDFEIRTGPDIIKALALGAQAVLNLNVTLGPTGFTSLSEIQGKSDEGEICMTLFTAQVVCSPE